MLNSVHKNNRGRKNREKDGRALHKLMNNDKYCKVWETLTNRIDLKVTRNTI